MVAWPGMDMLRQQRSLFHFLLVSAEPLAAAGAGPSGCMPRLGGNCEREQRRLACRLVLPNEQCAAEVVACRRKLCVTMPSWSGAGGRCWGGTQAALACGAHTFSSGEAQPGGVNSAIRGER